MAMSLRILSIGRPNSSSSRINISIKNRFNIKRISNKTNQPNFEDVHQVRSNALGQLQVEKRQGDSPKSHSNHI